VGIAVSVEVAVWVGVSVKVDVKVGGGRRGAGVAATGIWQARRNTIVRRSRTGFDFIRLSYPNITAMAR